MRVAKLTVTLFTTFLCAAIMAAVWFHTTLILAFLMLDAFSNFKEAISGPCTKGKEKWSWWENKTIVHYVSAVFEESQKPDENFDWRMLTPFYFEINDDVSSDPCWKDPKLGWPYSCASFGIEGISLMISKNTTRQEMISLLGGKMTSNTIPNYLRDNKVALVDSVIISLTDSIYCECSKIEKITDYLQNKLKIFDLSSANKSKVKLALEYNQHFIKCCKDESFPLLEKLDFHILRVEISPLNTMLSYGKFSKMINQVIKNNAEYVAKNDLSCSAPQVIRLASQNWENSISRFHRYEGLIAKYVEAWMKENPSHDNQVYIIPPPVQTNVFSSNSKVLREISTPVIYSASERNTLANFSLSACEAQETVRMMLTMFGKVMFHNPSPEFLSQLVTKCEYEDTTLPEDIQRKDSAITVLFDSQWINSNDFEKSIDKILSDIGKLLKIRTVYIDSGFIYQVNLNKIANLLHSKNIQTGCFVNGNALPNTLLDSEYLLFLNISVRACDEMFKSSVGILHHFPLSFSKEKELVRFLANFQQAKQIFEKVYQGKNLVPMMRMMRVGNVQANVATSSSIYCDSDLSQLNEYHQTVISFGNIHNWTSVIFASSFGKDLPHPKQVGFWQNVETDAGVDRRQTSFPLYSRSNAEKLLSSDDEKMPMTYSCIKFSENVSKAGINFLKNSLAGAFFEMEIRQSKELVNEELQTMLLFALARFSFVEVIGKNVLIIQKVAGVLNPDFLSAIKTFRKFSEITMPLVYIELPFREAITFRGEISNLVAQNYSAVHVQGWENENDREWNELYMSLHQAMRMPARVNNFGLTVQNCSHEMNLRLARLQKLPFINFVRYVVCNVSPVVANNFNRKWMQKYLNTLFYTKAYMERFLPTQNGRKETTQLIFRINLDCLNGRNHRELFLRFLNDMNQHSEAYKIKYFIVRAFENEELAEYPRSWWHLKNYSDLTSQSIYLDRELDYLGRSTNPPIIFQINKTTAEAELSTSGHSALYFLVIPALAVLFLLALLPLWVQRRHYKKKILTPREVNEFYNGTETSQYQEMSMVSISTFDATYMKFSAEFEIPASDIEIREVVGRGEFGVVHRGILSESMEIAIKVPRSDCTKEQFKSALSELKILCYIGSHPNIVSFLGACTKEIQKGKLRICTEYCSKGSLEGYLRNLQNTQIGDGAFGTLDISQLYDFSLQIASGMEYIAKRKIIHGDLAARNVLLSYNHTCKISDFGLSRRLYELSEYVKKGTEPLPWRWMAPESLTKMEFTTKSDVWSYGVTLWEIFSLGMLPYPGKVFSDHFIVELYEGVRMGRAPFATSTIHDKLLDCWSLSQEKRPTFTELKLFCVDLIHHDYQNTTLV